MKLSLNEKEVSLVLQNGDKIIDKKQWIDENNLLEKFFPILDDMLARNNLTIQDINHCDLVTSIPRGHTTARIARTIIKTINFALTS